MKVLTALLAAPKEMSESTSWKPSSSGWRCESLTTRLFWRSTRKSKLCTVGKTMNGAWLVAGGELFQVAEQQDVHRTEVVRIDVCVQAPTMVDA